MFNDNNSIIVVDNNSEDLASIAHVFNTHGIGCRTIECDGFELPQVPLKGVKIAFFDINFTDAGDDTAIMSALRSVMKSTISNDNGPFALVFWTTKPQMVESYKEFVNRDDTYKELPRPVVISTLDKSQFMAQPELLHDSIEQICSSPLTKCLLSFREELQTASDDCLLKITSLIDVDEPWGETTKYEKRFKEIFAKISITTLGMQTGRTSPDLAIKESLAPVFSYNLCNNGSNVWKEYLHLEDKDENVLRGIDIKSIAPYLNTYFHIEPIVTDTFARGVVRKMNNDEELFKNMTEFDIETWVEKRFLKNKYPLSKEYYLIAIEYSAACDYANNKPRLHKFILGLLCAEDDAANIAKKKIADNIFCLGFSFIYNSEKCSMVFDLNSSFNEEQGEVFKLLGEPLFKLKHEMMNVITSAHAIHESRLGFSCFK